MNKIVEDHITSKDSPSTASDRDARKPRFFEKIFTKNGKGKKAEAIYWPEDFLARDFPNSRIMTWGYNTTITKGYRAVNQVSLFSHARNLLYDLQSERRKVSDRPLIFVAHSLGGILVKECLRRSEVDSDPQIKSIYIATIGVLFFGTPHRGSAHWASLGEVVSKMAGTILSIDVNSEIIRALLPTSPELELCRESFVVQWEDRRQSAILPVLIVRTYQEGTGMTGINMVGANKKVFHSTPVLLFCF